MSIREEIRALAPETSDYRKFGLMVGGVFAVLGALLYFWRGHEWAQWMLWIGAVLVILGAVAPRALKPIYYPWMAMAFALGFVMTRVILSIFFVLVLVPVGLFFKLIGRDALNRKIDRSAASYWIVKEYLIRDRTRLEKFF